MSSGGDASLDPLQPLGTLEPLEPLEAVPLVARGRREWVQTISDAWHLRRTKIGFVMFIVLLAIALFGRFVAPYSPTEFVGPPFSLPASAYVRVYARGGEKGIMGIVTLRTEGRTEA